MRALRNAREHIQNAGVNLPRVSLAGDRNTGREAHLFRNHRIDLLNLLFVSLKELLERSLGTRGALAAQQFHVREHMVEILEIQKELVHPERGTLSHCGRLRRLEMGKGEGR